MRRRDALLDSRAGGEGESKESELSDGSNTSDSESESGEPPGGDGVATELSREISRHGFDKDSAVEYEQDLAREQNNSALQYEQERAREVQRILCGLPRGVCRI